MPHFRCTSCHERVHSPVVIGAGDCPNCGGDVVFDVHRRADLPAPRPRSGEHWVDRARRRLRRRR